jgi:type I restriction enzyme M protein
VLANDAQLQVNRYVLASSKKRLQARLAAAQTAPLGDLVWTVRPMLTVKDGDDCVEALEVGAADLPPFGYIREPGRAVKIDRQTAVSATVRHCADRKRQRW